MSFPMLIGGLLIILALLVVFSLKKGVPCAIFVPTPSKVITRMLKFADLHPHETLYDLGSGSGKIVLMAAQEHGATSVGVEANPILAWYAKLRVRRMGLEDKVKIIRGNLFEVDLREADAITLYLSQYANDRLRRKMEKELKPGTRVISHIFCMTGWKTSMEDPENGIFFYVAPNAWQTRKIPC